MTAYRPLLLAACLAAAIGYATPALSASAKPGAGWYEEFIETGEIDDLLEQRLKYIHHPYFDPIGERYRPRYSQMAKAFRDGDCEQALENAQKILQRNPFALYTNHVAAECWESQGDDRKSAFYRYVTDVVYSHLDASGDGLSLRASIEVITVREAVDYLFLKDFEVRQWSFEDNGGPHLRVDVLHKVTGEPTHFYFDVDLWYRELVKRGR